VTPPPDSFFVREGDLYRATELTRGPWSPHHQHGGPPSALLAGLLEEAHEAAGGDDARIARFTMMFHKPIGIDRFRVEVESVREGKKVRVARAHLLAAKDGKPVASAEALFVRRDTSIVEATPVEPPRAPADCPPFEFSFFREAVGYHTAMEGRLIDGVFGEGKMAVWMRARVSVLPGEALSPIQRVVVAADSGNGISVALDLSKVTFVNPDLTVVLGRACEGEWVAVDAKTTVGPDGIGIADALLSDARGSIGRGVQSLIIERRA
jgi:hypothetical protein